MIGDGDFEIYVCGEIGNFRTGRYLCQTTLAALQVVNWAVCRRIKVHLGTG